MRIDNEFSRNGETPTREESQKQLADILSNMDWEKINAANEKLTRVIDNEMRLRMAQDEIKRLQCVVAYLVARQGGTVFIRNSERARIAEIASIPGIKPPFEIKEEPGDVLNGVRITADKDFPF